MYVFRSFVQAFSRAAGECCCHLAKYPCQLVSKKRKSFAQVRKNCRDACEHHLNPVNLSCLAYDRYEKQENILIENLSCDQKAAARRSLQARFAHYERNIYKRFILPTLDFLFPKLSSEPPIHVRSGAGDSCQLHL